MDRKHAIPVSTATAPAATEPTTTTEDTA